MDSLNQASIGKLEFLSGAALDSVLDSPDFKRMLQQTLLENNTTESTTVAPVLGKAASIKVDSKTKMNFSIFPTEVIKKALDKIEEAFNKFEAAL